MTDKTRRRAMAIVGVLLATACGDSGGTAEPGDPCSGTVDCTPGSICYHEVCVGEGALRFSISWEEETDIDLHVLTPNGEEIYFGLRAAGGGRLDVDDCVGEVCSQMGTHVENVVFDATAQPGTYMYWAENFAGTAAVNVTVEAFTADGVQATFTDPLPAVSGSQGTQHSFDY